MQTPSISVKSWLALLALLLAATAFSASAAAGARLAVPAQTAYLARDTVGEPVSQPL